MFCIFFFSSSLPGQGVIGLVADKISRQPVGEAIVSVLRGDTVVALLSTNQQGQYQYDSQGAERIRVLIRAAGYNPLTSDDILLDGYSTFRLENLLDANVFVLDSVTVEAGKIPESFGHIISAEDLVFTAANFDDPLRVAISMPGVVQLNDQANHLSMRGKSPVFNGWYLEGLEIVNPNHTSNAGTLSDLPTQYGGGVNMFSAQILGSTNIYTGLNPISIGNSSGAAIDMELYESAKPEWRAKAGFIGFELGGGTSLGGGSIIDFNLRYSFTGLLSNLGVDFGGERIGFYDGVASFRNQGRRHKLKLFAWAGRSENKFDKVENADDITEYKDFFDIDYGNDILGMGGRYDLTLGKALFLKSGFSYSTNQSSYLKNGLFESVMTDIDRNDEISITSSFLELTFLYSQRVHSTLGIHYSKRAYDKESYYSLPFPEEARARPSLEFVASLSSAFQLQLAGDLYHSFTHHFTLPGYRAVLSFSPHHTYRIYAGARHSIGEPSFHGYSIRSDNYEMGYSLSGKNQMAGINVYYQQMNHIAVYFLAVEPIAFEYLSDYPNSVYAGALGFNQDGISRNLGIEGQWNYKSNSGLILDFNQSVYKSERGITGTTLDGGRYDGRFTSHMAISKEIIHEKKGKNRIWNLSLRGLLNGGLWEPVIDELQSDLQQTTVYAYPVNYDQHLSMYKRLDMGISRTIATTKIRWRYSLNVQNVLGLTNVAYHYYDPFLHEVKAQEQLGLIPIFSVQASW
ncbi:MAG: hypothetical protein ABIQ02_05545 [Saprospiraceae bacterium]